MKTKEKLDPNRIVIVTMSHASQERSFSRGERVRASTPSLDLNWTVADGTPPSEWPARYDEDPPQVELGTNVRIREIEIPVHRRVISQIDLAEPARWAPGSIGQNAATRPPPFARTLLRKGEVVDVLDPRVTQYPAGSFRWIERDVTPEDIERMEQLERHNS